MKTRTKATVQMTVGVISGILLIFCRVVANMWGIVTYYQLAHNPQLLRKLGYEPDSISYNGFLEGMRFSYHIFGLCAIFVYLISLFLKRRRVALVSFCVCTFYVSMVVLFNIISLTPEERARGLTVGGWIGKALPPVIGRGIEMIFLLQGYLGLKKLEKEPNQETQEIAV